MSWILMNHIGSLQIAMMMANLLLKFKTGSLMQDSEALEELIQQIYRTMDSFHIVLVAKELP